MLKCTEGGVAVYLRLLKSEELCLVNLNIVLFQLIYLVVGFHGFHKN